MSGDAKEVMRDNFLQYASYVILDRAIPHALDGLKPVQRRILFTLHKIDDGKLHKVANVVGQTMALHPHGDAAIGDALVHMASKNYVLDRQGNFGNLFTGDPASAARYIETRLSPLARETLFNKNLTNFIASYDSRNEEPTVLPAKIPLLLMHGAEGIAVGMSTRILPHNFVELLEAEVAILEGKAFEVLPDFPTGGILDATEYDKGRGKVKLRARVQTKDDKTIVIDEICFGTTTESLVRSIDDAAKAGKIKIDSISDYTAEKVEIEITLPRGQHAKDLIPQLYAFTDCEVSISTNCLVINENLPWEADVESILHLHTQHLQGYLKRELEIERDRLLEKIFEKTLEQIFIENRLYKKIEEVSAYDKIHATIAKSLTPYHDKLTRVPDMEDRERLLRIPIRRISRFDIDKNQEEITALQEALIAVEKDLKGVKRYTIRYLKDLIKKYGKLYPRHTRFGEIATLDKRKLEKRALTVGFDPTKGFLGTQVKSETPLPCTNLDKLLVMTRSSYSVINIPDKLYVKDAIFVGVADKKTTFSVIYRTNGSVYGKRFIVDRWILERDYPIIPEDGELLYMTTDSNISLELKFKPQAKQKVKSKVVALDEIPIKGVKARGIRLATKPVSKVSLPGSNKQLTLF